MAKKRHRNYFLVIRIWRNVCSLHRNSENAVREKICNGKDIGLLSKELATIVKDVDINFDFEGTHIELPSLDEVTAFLQKMQFYSFIRGIDGILGSFDKNAKKVDAFNSELIQKTPSPNPYLSQTLHRRVCSAESSRRGRNNVSRFSLHFSIFNTAWFVCTRS